MTVKSTGGVPDRIVVVGAGVAGIAAVERLRSLGHSGKITVIDAGEQPYDRPPLSKAFLLGEAGLEQIRLVPESWFDENDVELRARRSAVRLRPAEGSVELDDGSHAPADAVLLATGGVPRPLPVPGGNLPGVHVLRTIEDARGLREALVPGAGAVVIGGGLIGAEVASSAVALGCEVTLIEPVDPPLAAAVGTEIATLLHRQHTQAGIRVVTDTVARLEGGSGRLTVVTGTGKAFTADVVVAGIGMTVPGDLARTAGLDTADGVIVDRFHRTSHPAVFAAGDSARVCGPDGRLHRREHWQAAQQGGRAAAAAMLGQPPAVPDPDWFWSDRHGVHVESVGDLRGYGRHVRRGTSGSLPLTVFNLADDGRVLGAAAVDDPRAIAAARRLIGAGAAPDPDLLADTSVNPRTWLRG
ncbi:FAD-dependent oxidoreductase [Streptomyces sp. NPDC026665]|uniref:NAD(P)/FAD-dependent oxidoreductase n=1 Tax=Streptomyces sp. NPDC026665 TaxID=3154798 RepID=UPI003402E736